MQDEEFSATALELSSSMADALKSLPAPHRPATPPPGPRLHEGSPAPHPPPEDEHYCYHGDPVNHNQIIQQHHHKQKHLIASGKKAKKPVPGAPSSPSPSSSQDYGASPPMSASKRREERQALKNSSESLMRRALENHFQVLSFKQDMQDAEQVLEVMAGRIDAQRQQQERHMEEHELLKKQFDEQEEQIKEAGIRSKSNSAAPGDPASPNKDENGEAEEGHDKNTDKTPTKSAGSSPNAVTVVSPTARREIEEAVKRKLVEQYEAKMNRRVKREVNKMNGVIHHLKSMIQVVLSSRKSLEVQRSRSPSSRPTATAPPTTTTTTTNSSSNVQVTEVLRDLAAEIESLVSASYSTLVEASSSPAASANQDHFGSAGISPSPPVRHRSDGGGGGGNGSLDAIRAESLSRELEIAKNEANEQSAKADRLRLKLVATENALKHHQAARADERAQVLNEYYASAPAFRYHDQKDSTKNDDDHHHHHVADEVERVADVDGDGDDDGKLQRNHHPPRQFHDDGDDANSNHVTHSSHPPPHQQDARGEEEELIIAEFEDPAAAFRAEFRIRKLEAENAQLVDQAERWSREAAIVAERNMELEVAAAKYKMEVDTYKEMYDTCAAELTELQAALNHVVGIQQSSSSTNVQ